ncbi:LPXTG cell wall anchor domain-containing protein [uncultured Faecalibacterium sp.]|uniref:LPXTG cell wall anchor domain-containing protein n=1 Tax=uncultured Faecalibacterium sp. TaxID=259315 RepID=UPI0026DCE66D|nr:LPXTG cell wall anchor domain-containing protein [uncultured Faecalibacterium sp.]
MTLALSVLSSSVGMCGASAAEALSDTDGSGLQVTVVPLADNTETPAPTAESKTPAQEEETPVEKDQPVASTGDNTDQPTDGEGEGDNNTSSDDKPTIERPEQSDTVETLPGTAKDNIDHIKGEDKDDTEDKGEEGSGSEGTPEEKGEEGSGSEETPEEKPEETPKEDDTDYSCAYDPKSGHFKITFNIKEDAEGDQTIELSKVNEVVHQYGEDVVDKWLATEEGQNWYKNEEGWIGLDKVEKNVKIANNVEYCVSYTRDENGNIQRKVALVPQAGDTVIYDVSLANGSKHTYVYQDGSLTVATAKLPKNDNPNASVGFDGQPLPDIIADTNVVITYNRGKDVHGCMEDLIDQLDVDRQYDSPSTVRRAVDKYIKNHYNGDYDAYILDYYNKKDGTRYTSVNDLLANNEAALTDLNKSGTGEKLHSITFDSPTYYNHFYKNVLSLKVDDSDKLEEFKKDTGVSWNSSGKELTIGDYMYDKLNSTEGAWDKANSYFNALLSSGLNEDEATWAAFALAVNLDGELANNNIQNKPLSWYASMVLHQTDGTLDLTKTDADGNVIGDDEGEGQTSFYLWKYETDKETGEKNPMYCTYVEPTYTTNKDGEQVLEKDGFYCWVKYDPTKDKLTYTVTTTNGKLNIDYALLENVVYYLQEAIAPDGYDTDPEIYVICDEESYKELEGTEVTNPATGATSKVTADSWLGSILGGKPLSINFVNTATVPDPDPEPTPDPDPVPPVDPDIPVDPANPDNPPVQDAAPDETPVTPENPQNPAVQDATPDAAALPQTGTTSWMAGVLASLGSLLLACGWFFTRKQYSPKH